MTGTVYRYDVTAAPIFSGQVRIWPSDQGVGSDPNEFGYALDLDGDLLAIGADREDIDPIAAYVSSGTRYRS